MTVRRYPNIMTARQAARRAFPYRIRIISWDGLLLGDSEWEWLENLGPRGYDDQERADGSATVNRKGRWGSIQLGNRFVNKYCAFRYEEVILFKHEADAIVFRMLVAELGEPV